MRRTHASRAVAVASLALVLGVAGCGGDTADTRSETAGLPDLHDEIQRQRWELEPSDSSVDAHATFGVEGDVVSGLGPCNSYRGTIAIDGSAVEINDLASTLQACVPALMAADAAFVAALEAVDTVRVTDDRMVLTGPDDIRLAFDGETRTTDLELDA